MITPGAEDGSGYQLRRTKARLNQVNDVTAPLGSNKPDRVIKACKRSRDSPKDKDTEVTATTKKRAASGSDETGQAKKNFNLGESANSDGGLGQIYVPNDAAEASGTNFHALVTETLRTFNKHYLHSIQEEEKRCAGVEVEEKNTSKVTGTKKNIKPKKNGTSEDITKSKSKRPDLKAITQMMNSKTVIYPEKIIGQIPGIDVGHQFFSRAEMVVVGFHHHWLNGINFIGQSTKKESGMKDYKYPITVSIVLSGQYEDDLDNCEDIVYTGQGGNNLLGNKRQFKDQEMSRGNLGLKNCIEQSIPVRVIRGRKCKNSYVGKVYTYDGLYKVVKYWAEKGVSGFTVYKFRLKRVEGQPPLTNDEQVLFTRGRIPTSVSEIRGLVCEDISGGLEDIPIPVTNLVDDPPIAPPADFTYIKVMKYSKNIIVPNITPTGCNCLGETCTDPRKCACAKLNGGDFPYVQRDGGRLVEPRDVVFECGPNCGCGPKCVNKTSQTGLKFRFEIYRTAKKGWGVRSWDYIPSGAPICEYIGHCKRTDDLDPAADNSYVFDIDCLQTMKGLDGRESRLRDVSLPSYLQKTGEEVSETVPFCIDAAKTGNFARFINHSCQPNLFVQCLLSNHHDMRLARVILFAADNIPPLKELTYDYGYAIDSVIGLDGQIQQVPCFCGAEGCRKRLY